MKILIVNIGSESKKYALYGGEREVWSVHIENRQDKLEESRLADRFEVIAFRVVAPGAFFRQHRVVDDNYLKQLENARAKMSLHIEPVLTEIRFFQTRFPGSRLVAISDSAFHQTIPDYARCYALPTVDTTALEIERFGYHGISLSSIVETLRRHGPLPEKMVICHLGGGSSVTALRNGESVDTTMGLTPLAGLPMATRVGDLDPGALVYLAEAKNLRGEELEKYLANQCGFLGLAGTSDMRELLARESGDERAGLAIKMFVYQIQKYIGAYSAILGGLDQLVFSGTIGERSETIRAKILASLNLSGTKTVIIPSNETAEIARLVSIVASQDA